MATLPAAPSLLPGECTYTACYCEENVYKLCSTLVEKQAAKLSDLYAVFISNVNKVIPIWCQRSSRAQDGLVWWDYHVILLQRHAGADQQTTLVWDLDTQLDFPCSFLEYAHHALRCSVSSLLQPQYQRCYRVVPAAQYLQHFASNREHMRGDDGSWKTQPPVYPCIVASDGTTMSLYQYWDMEMTGPAADDEDSTGGNSKYGQVLPEHELLNRFSE